MNNGLYCGLTNLVCFDKMGAVVGYGGSLQESCLEGFDFLGLHQILCRINSVVECFVANENVIGSNPISCSSICLVSLMVELCFYTAVTAVRFCHEVPKIYPISEMNITPCYERGSGGLIPSLGANYGE